MEVGWDPLWGRLQGPWRRGELDWGCPVPSRALDPEQARGLSDVGFVSCWGDRCPGLEEVRAQRDQR